MGGEGETLCFNFGSSFFSGPNREFRCRSSNQTFFCIYFSTEVLTDFEMISSNYNNCINAIRRDLSVASRLIVEFKNYVFNGAVVLNIFEFVPNTSSNLSRNGIPALLERETFVQF